GRPLVPVGSQQSAVGSTPAAGPAPNLQFAIRVPTSVGDSQFAIPPLAQDPTSPATEQRRRVAILFADLVGSTQLADRLDPDVTYRLVSRCIASLGDIVPEEGGYVAKTLGDGLMALFGAPVAHGDDPARGARAALRMQAWMRAQEER